MIEIKKLTIKFLIVIIGIAILKALLNEFLPELFTSTIVDGNTTHSKTSFFGVYQTNIFNLIPAILMSFELNIRNQNWIIIPVLSVISLNAGLFFFSIVILHNLINNYERV